MLPKAPTPTQTSCLQLPPNQNNNQKATIQVLDPAAARPSNSDKSVSPIQEKEVQEYLKPPIQEKEVQEYLKPPIQ